MEWPKGAGVAVVTVAVKVDRWSTVLLQRKYDADPRRKELMTLLGIKEERKQEDEINDEQAKRKEATETRGRKSSKGGYNNIAG